MARQAGALRETLTTVVECDASVQPKPPAQSMCLVGVRLACARLVVSSSRTMLVSMAIGGVPHTGVWVLDRCSDPKFPYRLRMYRGDRLEPVLSFLVRDRWPGANQHIFCLREQRAPAPLEIGDEVERVPVVALQRYGKRLTVILDRARQKRCDFQIVEKAYKVSRAWRTDDVRADLLVHPDVDAAAAPT